jgi:hypothetical protein
MKRRYRDPHDPKVHEAVLDRIRRMTREEWQQSVEELSRAPEGVEDPWPPYEEVATNGFEPAQTDGTGVLPERGPCDPQEAERTVSRPSARG